MATTRAAYDYRGKRAMVTGGSRGIGHAIARELANAGATVVSVSRTPANSIPENSSIVPVMCDIGGNYDDIKKALTPHLPVDYLVNSAGISIVEPFLQMKPESLSKVFEINVQGTLRVSQMVASSMVESGTKGSIVHISSQASIVPLVNHTVYCLCKAAIDSMCKTMALELGSNGIRVNCVNPTVVMTDMGRMAWSDPAKSKPLLDRMPIRRFAEVNDVVDAVLWLLSDSSSMTTGACIPVDGGMTST